MNRMSQAPFLSPFFLLLIVGAASPVVSAFGLKTHLWIGTRVLEDVSDDCALSIRGANYDVQADTCAALRSRAGDFLSGTLGPDIYPDLVTGQSTTHPGIENGWQTDGFLGHVLNSAQGTTGLAFATGFLTHAAGDTFAHTYVNTYAGDLFELGDERTVERRHFVLEKYIDGLLPQDYLGADELTIPAEFVRDTLVHNFATARQYVNAGYGGHLAAMTRVHQAVSDSVEIAEDIEGKISGPLATVLAEYAELEAKVASGEVVLGGAVETLRAHEQTLVVRKRALTAAQHKLKQPVDALAAADRRFNQATAQFRATSHAVSAASKVASDASREAAKLKNGLTDLEHKLATTPTKIAEKHCRVVEESICHVFCPGGRWNPICREVCEPVRKNVCETVKKVNQAWVKLNKRVASARKKATNAQRNAQQRAGQLASAKARQAAALAEQKRRHASRSAATVAKRSADAAFSAAKRAVDVERKLVAGARGEVQKAQQHVENLRKKLVDKDREKETLEGLINELDLLSFFLKNWVKGMDLAGTEYVETGLKVSQGMLRGHSGLARLYREWLSCHGGVYLADPYQFEGAPCVIEVEYRRFQQRVDKILDRVLPAPINRIRAEIGRIETEIKKKIEDAVMDATLLVVEFAVDKTTADFMDLLANPENASRSKLVEVFTSSQDESGKNLLSFTDVAALVDADLGLDNGVLNVQDFKTLDYALVLAKLALLKPDQLKRLVENISGETGFNIPVALGGGRYSLLIQSLRSIDGNHQWQPYGLPYPRASGTAPEPADAQERHFGYGPLDGGGKGFFLFIDPNLRQKVFLKLFPDPMIGKIGEQPELKAAVYPFETCSANPFPVAFAADGSAAASDEGCD